MYKRRSKWYNKRGGFVPRTSPIQNPSREIPGSTASPRTGSKWRTGGDYKLPSRKWPDFKPLGSPDRRSDKTGIERHTGTETKPELANKIKRRTPVQVKTKEKDEKEKEPMPRRGRPGRPKGARNKKKPDIDSKRIYPKAAGSSYSSVYVRVPVRIRTGKLPRGFKYITAQQESYSIISARAETAVGQQTFYSFMTGSTAYWTGLNALIPSSNNTTQYIVDDTSTILTMTNNSNVNAFIEIWDGYYRRNQSNTPSNLWSNGMVDEGGTTSTCQQWGMDPFKSLAFRKLLKVKAVRRVELAEGRSHFHKVVTKYGSRWCQEEYNQNTTTYLDGWTRWTMVIIRGAPINSQATTTNVSTGAVALDMVFESKVRYRYISPTNETISILNSLPTVTDPYVINAATGTGAADIKV